MCRRLSCGLYGGCFRWSWLRAFPSYAGDAFAFRLDHISIIPPWRYTMPFLSKFRRETHHTVVLCPGQLAEDRWLATGRRGITQGQKHAGSLANAARLIGGD